MENKSIHFRATPEDLKKIAAIKKALGLLNASNSNADAIRFALGKATKLCR